MKDTSVGRKLPCLSTSLSVEPQVVLMYRPVVANQQPQLIPRAVLQPHSNPTADGTTYTVMAAPSKSSPQPPSLPHVSTTPPLTLSSSPHVLPSVPHILTSNTPSSQPTTSSSPTVVNGLVHLKPTEIRPVQLFKTSPENKKMDISCLTKEGVARTQTPPPLLRIQNRNEVVKTESETSPVESSQNGDLAPREEVATPEETEQQRERRQEVMVVQTSPPSGMQRVLVIGEKGESSQPHMVLPVAYDQQLISMPIYRVGSSLGSLQPVQVLASLPSAGGTATT